MNFNKNEWGDKLLLIKNFNLETASSYLNSNEFKEIIRIISKSN
jgi:hypothetical protein